MNILIADTNQQTIAMLEAFKSNDSTINIFEAKSSIDGLDKYKNNNIDLVIIDFDVNDYVDLLKEIIKIDSFQKTITISKSLCYSENLGCDFCIEKHNRIRLLKPFSVKELFDTIQNFNIKKCKYFKSLENIEDFMDDIIKRYSNYSYDNVLKQIKIKNNKLSSYNSMQDLLDIVDMLKKYNVKHSIESENLIQLF